MTVTDDDVGAEVARGHEHTQRQRVDYDTEESPACLRSLSQSREIGDVAEEIRVLHGHERGVLVQHLHKIFGFGLTLFVARDREPHALCVRTHDLAIVGVDRCRDHDLVSFATMVIQRQDHGLR